jgi:hypothetical protein
MRAWTFSEASVAQALDQWQARHMEAASGNGETMTRLIEQRKAFEEFLYSDEAAKLRIRSCEPGNGQG